MQLHPQAIEIAQFGASADWDTLPTPRKAELIKEVSDSLHKGVPASWFAETAIKAFNARQAAIPTPEDVAQAIDTLQLEAAETVTPPTAPARRGRFVKSS